MNITFLIGNGFDINLGRNTRYTDFYPYYLSKKHDDIISKALAENYDRWADLELALGQLLSDVAPDQVTEFLDSKGVLESDLADYLRIEEQRIDVTGATVQEEFQEDITGFYNEFATKDKELMKESKKDWQGRGHQLVGFCVRRIAVSRGASSDGLTDQINELRSYRRKRLTAFMDIAKFEEKGCVLERQTADVGIIRFFPVGVLIHRREIIPVGLQKCACHQISVIDLNASVGVQEFCERGFDLLE